MYFVPAFTLLPFIISERINKCLLLKGTEATIFRKLFTKANSKSKLKKDFNATKDSLTFVSFAFIFLLYFKLNFCRIIYNVASTNTSPPRYNDRESVSLSHIGKSTSFQTYPPYPHYNGGGEQVRTVPPLVSGELAGG